MARSHPTGAALFLGNIDEDTAIATWHDRSEPAEPFEGENHPATNANAVLYLPRDGPEPSAAEKGGGQPWEPPPDAKPLYAQYPGAGDPGHRNPHHPMAPRNKTCREA